MPITDIVTHIEVASPTNPPAAEPSSRTDGDHGPSRRSGYQDALSRSLNENGRRRQEPASDAGAPQEPPGGYRSDANPSAGRVDRPVTSDDSAELETKVFEPEDILIELTLEAAQSAERPEAPAPVIAIEGIAQAEERADQSVDSVQTVTAEQALESTLELVSSDASGGPPASFQVTFETVGQTGEASAGTSDVATLDTPPRPPGGFLRIDQRSTLSKTAATIVEAETLPTQAQTKDASSALDNTTGAIASRPRPATTVVAAAPQPPAARPAAFDGIELEIDSSTSRPAHVGEVVVETVLQTSEPVPPHEGQPHPGLAQRSAATGAAESARLGPAGQILEKTAAAPALRGPRDGLTAVAEGSTPAGAEVAASGERVAATGTTHANKTESPIRAGELVDRVTELIRLSQQNNRPLRVRLHPPELGALQIEVFSRDGVVSARLQVETSAAHRAILESLPLLQESLMNHGSAVDRIDVQLSTNLQDHRHADLNRQGDGEQDGSPGERERQQQEADRRGRQDDRRQSRHGRRQPDMDEIDVEV